MNPSHPSAVSTGREDYRLRVFAARSKRRQQHRARGGGGVRENIVNLLHEDIISILLIAENASGYLFNRNGDVCETSYMLFLKLKAGSRSICSPVARTEQQ
ncbi:hypothetical protein PBY51_007135 [Eleginops maclovinus]|uniref:Uncharacterized protein n=1 Tax=Eleginops maclovinus TaxID=56733 RepID=A0AAN7X2J0_ELEMC|nr:hypothetical protein PBY51_007135 [Eleginops maclovinus]